MTPGVAFAKQATKNGVLDPPRSEGPSNIDEVCEWHHQLHRRIFPAESEFEHYAHLVSGSPEQADYDCPNCPEDAESLQVLPARCQPAPHPEVAEALEYLTFLPFCVNEEVSEATV
ncbi:360d753c-71c8-49ff-95eb-9be425eb1431 [Thermothielavioides terrestris]|uniref:360d753c-71c8-49ff-95eb-9be425eb1431 n=1 Tax=Thermothielavioides terrestris TaxID=2587410 RepID=A0A446BWB1_9PEZI|nr:360d753c-71c8-49ff-95eb-9be425eb1431 [Thermothielavioides terrestris]